MGSTVDTEVTGPLPRIDQRADLKLRLPGDAVDGGYEAGELEVDPGGFDRGLGGLDLSLGGLHRGLGGQVVLHGVVQILLARGLFFGEGCVRLYVELSSALNRFGVGELRFGLRQLPLGLVESRLKRPRIDLEEELALLDESPFLIALPHAGSP